MTEWENLHYKVKFKVNSFVKIKDMDNTKALVTSIDICGDDPLFDIWYNLRWLIDGGVHVGQFLATELEEDICT